MKINFVTGGGGNHIRWLLYPDKIFQSLEDYDNKLDFIKAEIYNNDRSWDNWLIYEWEWRSILDPIIEMSHMTLPNDYDKHEKNIWLYFNDIEKVIKRYFHINLGSNSLSPDMIKYQSKQWDINNLHAEHESKVNPDKVLYLEADFIFDKDLDRNKYNQIIQFFDLEDHYSTACEIQKLYYNCRMNAAHRFANYFTSLEFTDHVLEMKNLK